jgi:hypothetical protein
VRLAALSLLVRVAKRRVWKGLAVPGRADTCTEAARARLGGGATDARVSSSPTLPWYQLRWVQAFGHLLVVDDGGLRLIQLGLVDRALRIGGGLSETRSQQ